MTDDWDQEKYMKEFHENVTIALHIAAERLCKEKGRKFRSPPDKWQDTTHINQNNANG